MQVIFVVLMFNSFHRFSIMTPEVFHMEHMSVIW